MIKKTYELALKELETFKKTFNIEYEKILECNLSRESKLKNINSYKNNFFSKIINNSKNNNIEIKFEICTKKSLSKINTSLKNYQIKCEELCNNACEKKLNKIDLSTIEELIKNINKTQEKIKNIISKIKITNHNKYYIDKKNINHLIYEIETNLRNIMLICINFSKYTYKIETEELKKIPKKKLKKGDIIVEQISKDYNQIKGKVISFFLESPIIHVMLVYKNSKYGLYVFDAETTKNKLDTKIYYFEKKNHIEYLILRPKIPLKKSQLVKLDNFIIEHISTPYSRIKTIGLATHKIKNFISEKLKINTKRNSNPFDFSKGIFCSELISKAYHSMGIEITYENNHSMAFPLDIVNSKHFEIIGILK